MVSDLKLLPSNLVKLKEKLLKEISPLKPADESTRFIKSSYSTRSNTGRSLPEYYLVYFLLVELLGFKDLGRMEKVAWEIPIDFKGKGYLIAHKKFGLGLFLGKDEDEDDAEEIVNLIKSAIGRADLFYSWKVDQKIKTSSINIKNEYQYLLDRYYFFRTLSFDKKESTREGSWLAISAVEAFFSWTEHAFILMAVLQSKIENGEDFVRISKEEWKKKFQVCISLNSRDADSHFNRLLRVKDDVRNYMAHGSFGREGETFHFHSKVGAVPVAISKIKNQKLSMVTRLYVSPQEILKELDDFIDFFHQDERKRALKYIKNTDYPINLGYVVDGTFKRALESDEDMEVLIKEVDAILFQSWNMEW